WSRGEQRGAGEVGCRDWPEIARPPAAAAARAGPTPAAPAPIPEASQADDLFARAATLDRTASGTRSDPFGTFVPAPKPAPALPTPSDPFGDYLPRRRDSEASKR